MTPETRQAYHDLAYLAVHWLNADLSPLERDAAALAHRDALLRLPTRGDRSRELHLIRTYSPDLFKRMEELGLLGGLPA